MNPCSKNKKAIALLAINALDVPQALELREHFSNCPGCHAFWDDMTRIRQALATGIPTADVDPSPRFYKRLEGRLKTARPYSGLEHLGLWMGRAFWNWRVALPAALLVLCVAVFAFKWEELRPPAPQIGSVSVISSDPAPTLANYKMVASQSLEQLSELLDRQGDKPLPPAPIYTASGGVLAKSSL
jgi:hypothetical protein